jgi:hypothetical protein
VEWQGEEITSVKSFITFALNCKNHLVVITTVENDNDGEFISFEAICKI